MTGFYEVHAVSNSGDKPRLRCTGNRINAVREAVTIARSSGSDGAVSVWVEGGGEVVWAAGEKASEMTRQGVEFGRYGDVLKPDTPPMTREDYELNLRKVVR